MNLLLLSQEDFISDTEVHITDQRHQHVLDVLQSTPQDTLKVGVINGNIGRGIITQLDARQLEMTVELNAPPPPALPMILVVALPRPKMIRRILRNVAEFGIKDIYFINSYKVEKSYWQSPALNPDNVTHYFLDGLSQAGDTILPNLQVRQRFKPFVEDELTEIIVGKQALLAHPGLGEPCPMGLNKPCCVAIGPEGGFIPYEVDKLLELGFHGFHLGQRILKVENAISHITGKLFSQ